MISTHRTNIYLTALIGLEAGLWGAVAFLHLLSRASINNLTAVQLAIPLVVMIAGFVGFGLSWHQAQRLARSDESERTHPVRSLFLYTFLLATLLPMAVFGLLLLRALFVSTINPQSLSLLLQPTSGSFSPLAPFLVNTLAAVYLFWVLWADQRAGRDDLTLLPARRWFRYVWLVWSVVVTALGFQQVLQGLGEILSFGAQAAHQEVLLNGMAFLVVGLPLWLFLRRRIQRSLGSIQEREALSRLAALVILTVTGLGGVILSGGLLFSAAARLAFGIRPESGPAWSEWIVPLSALLPFGGVLYYYGRQKQRVLKVVPEGPQRTEIQRAFWYTLLLLGSASVAFGVQRLLTAGFTWWADPLALRGFLADHSDPRSDILAALIGLGVGFLTLGLPLVLYAWRPLRRELRKEGEPGTQARRALSRRVYLGVGQILGALGGSVSLVILFLRGLDQLLGNLRGAFLLESGQWLASGVAFAAFLLFMILQQQGDERAAAAALQRRQAAFGVLLLTLDEPKPSENGAKNGLSSKDDFGRTLMHALQRQAPAVPVAIHSISKGVPDETFSAARLVILPSDLLVRPPEAIRLWLQAFQGMRLVIPVPSRGWRFIGTASLPQLARQTARQVRRLAEGKEEAG